MLACSQVSQRIQRFCVAAALLILSNLSQAIGLGELRHTSFLGEPLQATIELVAPGDYLPEEVKVGVVGWREAQRLGIPVVSGNFRFRLNPVMKDGRLQIIATTADPVTEPFINMLVELHWPEGKVVREYTLFLDPPAAITPAQAQTTSDQPRFAPKPAAPAQPREESARPRVVRNSQSLSGEQYKVQSGDTLSAIASRRALILEGNAGDISDWLLVNNPSAFIRNNPNLIKAGSVLVLPDTTALNLFKRPDNGLSAPLQESTPLPAAPDSSAIASAPAPAAQAPAKSPDSAPAAQSGLQIVTQQQTSDDAFQYLRDQLASTRETIDLLQRENTELQLRLQRIEQAGIEQSMQKLLLLKEQQIEDLQRQINDLKPGDPAQGGVHAESQQGMINSDTALPASTSENSDDTTSSVVYWLMPVLLVVVIALIVLVLRRPMRKGDNPSWYEDLSSRWRPDHELKESIAAKTVGYEPPVKVELYQTESFDIDEVISDALSRASEGNFDEAERLITSLLVKLGYEERLSDALHFIQKLKEKRTGNSP